MDSQESQTLNLKVQGQAELRALNEQLAAEQKYLLMLGDLHARYGMNSAEDAEQAKKSAIAIEQLTQRIAALKNTQDAATTASAKASGSAKDYRQSMLGLSYAMNDFLSVQGSFQQHMSAIANNMPMLLAGFGMLGPILSGLLPALGMVVSNFDAIAKVFGAEDPFKAFKGHVEELKSSIKELEAKPLKLAVDLTALEHAKKELSTLESGLAAFARLQTAHSEAEKGFGARIAGIHAEASAGGRDVVGPAAAQLAEDEKKKNAGLLVTGASKRDALTKEMARLNAMPAEDLEAEVAKAERLSTVKAQRDALASAIDAKLDAIQKESQAKVGNLWAKTEGGDMAAEEELVKLLRSIGNSGLADRIEQASPAAMRKQAFSQDATRKAVVQTIEKAAGKAGGFFNKRRIRREHGKSLEQESEQRRQAEKRKAVVEDPLKAERNAAAAKASLEMLREQKGPAGRVARAKKERDDHADRVKLVQKGKADDLTAKQAKSRANVPKTKVAEKKARGLEKKLDAAGMPIDSIPGDVGKTKELDEFLDGKREASLPRTISIERPAAGPQANAAAENAQLQAQILAGVASTVAGQGNALADVNRTLEGIVAQVARADAYTKQLVASAQRQGNAIGQLVATQQTHSNSELGSLYA